ncbi:hypothetical protein B296_00015340 [Ensete ventricosum]|uniref:Uncharacterized protein n=1 Tax=Ensete ventricosum TaxID=4639 RepID=A0A426YYV2_ENSVE|nr:hypothetical protein B296_00015340 [Ensete ventricosum]
MAQLLHRLRSSGTGSLCFVGNPDPLLALGCVGLGALFLVPRLVSVRGNIDLLPRTCNPFGWKFVDGFGALLGHCFRSDLLDFGRR